MYGPIQTIHVRPKKNIDFIKKKHSPHLSIEYRSYSLHSYHQSHNSHVNKKDGLWERGVFLQPYCHQKIAKAIFYFFFNLTPIFFNNLKSSSSFIAGNYVFRIVGQLLSALHA